MAEMTQRLGRQEPTAIIISTESVDTLGPQAVELYQTSGRQAMRWQADQLGYILARNADGLWSHAKYGYAVPRRNGKNEIVVAREFFGIVELGERVCHTAHKTTTSHAAWERLRKLMISAGWTELGRKKKDEVPPEKSFRTSKQYGLETITIDGGGEIVFRTRTNDGGLGEGFDLLIIDEAQEYTDKQESALIYTVSDSPNPQTIFCGTPPTATSAGTVFAKMRDTILMGEGIDSGWSEWSIEELTDDIENVDLWYETNPSMGTILTERKVRSEIRGDTVDFCIQRLGLWLRYSQKSTFTPDEWQAMTVKRMPPLEGSRHLGVKFGVDGLNVSLAVAAKTSHDRIFVEVIDCRPVRDGLEWMVPYLRNPRVESVVVDGANGQDMLADLMKSLGLKTPIKPKVAEVIQANAEFEQAIAKQTIAHKGQPSLTQAVTNCEKRAIGSSGGFGFKSIKPGVEISLVDSVLLARWACAHEKKKTPQRATY